MFDIWRRRIGTAVLRARRVPLLEELLEPVVLKQSMMDHDTTTKMKNYAPPVLADQLEASLSHELGRHIVKTDWSCYQDPIVEAQHEQAARLLHYTLSTIRRANSKYPSKTPPSDIGKSSWMWLQKECDLILREVMEGETQRWEDARLLAGAKWERLSETQKGAIQPAILLVGKNPYMHPVVKRRVIQQIALMVTKTIN